MLVVALPDILTCSSYQQQIERKLSSTTSQAQTTPQGMASVVLAAAGSPPNYYDFSDLRNITCTTCNIHLLGE